MVLGFFSPSGPHWHSHLLSPARQESGHHGVFCVIITWVYFLTSKGTRQFCPVIDSKNSSSFSFSPSKQPPPLCKLAPFVPFFLDTRFCLNFLGGTQGKFLKLELCFLTEWSCLCPRALKHPYTCFSGIIAMQNSFLLLLFSSCSGEHFHSWYDSACFLAIFISSVSPVCNLLCLWISSPNPWLRSDGFSFPGGIARLLHHTPVCDCEVRSEMQSIRVVL